MNFSKAAEELHVTRGAVSRQVALLEDWLGRALFVRSSSQLILTDAGRNYLHEVSGALTRLATASEYLSDNAATVIIRLNAPPTFTMRWLISRMSVFQRRYPGIDLRVTTFRPTSAYRGEEFDVAIRGETGPLEGHHSTPFLTEHIIPICHPDLLEGRGSLSVDDLRSHTLITYATESNTWPRWLASVGRPNLRAGGVLKFDPMYFALQAASEGLGIVLMPLFNVIDELIAGRLAAPFGLLGSSFRQYYVSYLPSSPVAQGAELFGAWLREEGRTTDEVVAEWARSAHADTREAEDAQPARIASSAESRYAGEIITRAA